MLACLAVLSAEASSGSSTRWTSSSRWFGTRILSACARSMQGSQTLLRSSLCYQGHPVWMGMHVSALLSSLCIVTVSGSLAVGEAGTVSITNAR
jgi:hypothetical protein